LFPVFTIYIALHDIADEATPSGAPAFTLRVRLATQSFADRTDAPLTFTSFVEVAVTSPNVFDFTTAAENTPPFTENDPAT
jgi:hypothetical protein